MTTLAKTHSIRAHIMRIIARGEDSSGNIGAAVRAATGRLSRRSIELHLRALVDEGRITRSGSPTKYLYSMTRAQREAFAGKAE